MGLAPAGEDALDVLVALDVAGLDERRPDRVASGRTRFSISDSIDEKPTSAPSAWSAWAIPQAIEWSLATPKISARPALEESHACPPLAAGPRLVTRRGICGERWPPGRPATRRPAALLRLGHPDVVEAGLDDAVRAGVGRREPEADRPPGVGRQVDRGRSPVRRSAPPARPAHDEDRRRACRRRRRAPRPGARRRTSLVRRGRTSSGTGASGRPRSAGRSCGDVTRRPSAVDVVRRGRRARPPSPVTNAYRPDGTPSGCFRPAAVVVGAGSPRCHGAAVAVSVPSTFTAQPRLTSRSSSKAPQRAIRTAAPRTASGQDGPLDQVQDGFLVPPGLGRDQRVVG